ncbi:hypothetical protein SEA_JABIRU_87 [Mycobacterium phage Jabiru]|nr:hypothetical protein SEA_JABIRU_87 [Mycobacterium phage Jabiru]
MDSRLKVSFGRIIAAASAIGAMAIAAGVEGTESMRIKGDDYGDGIVITEDDPRWDAETMGNGNVGPDWDCHTMGNQICEFGG